MGERLRCIGSVPDLRQADQLWERRPQNHARTRDIVTWAPCAAASRNASRAVLMFCALSSVTIIWHMVNAILLLEHCVWHPASKAALTSQNIHAAGYHQLRQPRNSRLPLRHRLGICCGTYLRQHKVNSSPTPLLWLTRSIGPYSGPRARTGAEASEGL